jgi:glycogen debranching enzyme
MSLGRDLCGSWDSAIRYEWLVTNGIGGFACGTVAGANTRRYHGFLCAGFEPPLGRMLMAAKVELCVHYLGRDTDLSCNEFTDGTISGRGFEHLESFSIADGIPVWRYAVADALLEQCIFMAPGENTTYLRLQLLRASAPVRVTLKPFVVYRDYHAHSRGSHPYRVETGDGEYRITAAEGAPTLRVALPGSAPSGTPSWYWSFRHRVEEERGLDAAEDLLVPGMLMADLPPGAPVFLTATAEKTPPRSGTEVIDLLAARSARLTQVLPKSAPGWVRALARASDQFVVRRKIADSPAPQPHGASPRDSGASTREPGASTRESAAPTAREGWSIIAGYPWFTDWGRDTMISLPGLATALRRFDLAAGLLRTYAGLIDGGMLPNRFSDSGQPSYNTADATLWMFEALDDYLHVNTDPALVRDVYPRLIEVIHAHLDGTRFGIRADPSDGLLRAGVPGVQLTWMDAKFEGEVFTPRIGKPVEINALWLNALDVTARLAARVRDGESRRLCSTWLARGSASFQRFWNEERRCLHDVIDGEDGPDSRIRPNQVIALALRYCAVSSDQARAIVTRCAEDLLTSHGLRSLGPGEPGYVGRYVGGPRQRDAAYHMGTVWSWLLGPFARAHYRSFGDARLAQSFLSPTAQHLDAACLGTVSEIFDGDAPHNARGCFAQAWSVAEILRSWILLERRISR